MDPLTAALFLAVALAVALRLLLDDAREGSRQFREIDRRARDMRAKLRAAASGQPGEKP